LVLRLSTTTAFPIIQLKNPQGESETQASKNEYY